MIVHRHIAVVTAFVAGLVAVLHGGSAAAQSLVVLPVNIRMAPGQVTTTLTVINQGTSGSAIQVRAFAWAQADGEDQLTISDGVLVSPPLATIAPGATQIVRLLLRRLPQGQEATFRILLDQIPPAAAARTVRVALRLSIPIFALPPTRTFPHVQFRVVSETGQAYLVALQPEPDVNPALKTRQADFHII